ncbi:hypothetical protein HanRHA438_Chr06g0257751 [Helianthus annuus]|nr:hypothetical protein HanIR_Chr06g0267511 [Helianthus annuus]KAJ0910939.1 hypothetical protein HanRHA438_Chr06g0257751 [Helianthus annuus]
MKMRRKRKLLNFIGEEIRRKETIDCFEGGVYGEIERFYGMRNWRIQRGIWRLKMWNEESSLKIKKGLIMVVGTLV